MTGKALAAYIVAFNTIPQIPVVFLWILARLLLGPGANIFYVIVAAVVMCISLIGTAIWLTENEGIGALLKYERHREAQREAKALADAQLRAHIDKEVGIPRIR